MYAITSAGSPKPPQMQKGTWSDSASANYVLMPLLGGVLYYFHPSFLTDTFFQTI